ncbi:hypothetical protein [Burkholderia sp. Ac-20379]|uniref:hypothetical protein n=1 Tax=Burkholderia sp. Ac-20379 TaxID=2703900 RepID=UPI00403F8D03
MVDERTGTVLLERNARQIRPIASVSKLMPARACLHDRPAVAREMFATAAARDASVCEASPGPPGGRRRCTSR